MYDVCIYIHVKILYLVYKIIIVVFITFAGIGLTFDFSSHFHNLIGATNVIKTWNMIQMVL